MEFYQIALPTRPSLTLPWPEVLLMPIGDVQAGVPACDIDRLKRHIDWGLEHGAYFLGMADYVDMASPSDRQRLRAADLYDVTTDAILNKAKADEEEFLKAVDGSAGRWLGLLQGHHYMAYPDGQTSDTNLAKALGAPFLGDCASLRVRITSGAVFVEAEILCHHGQGSSATEPGALSAVMKFGSGFGHHDIVLNGHHHKKVTTKKPRPYWNGAGELVSRNTVYAVTGSFLKGYLKCSQRDGRAGGSYIERRQLAPVALGGVALWLRIKPDGKLDVDISL